MAQYNYEDGDPYEVNERPRLPIRRWVWVTLALLPLALAAYLYLWRPLQDQGVPLMTQETSLNIPTPNWTGYKPSPPPAVAYAAVPSQNGRDRALEEEIAALRRELAQKQQQPAPGASQGQPPKPRQHRPMGYMQFSQPESEESKEALYTLAAGDTIVPCIVLTKMHSDIESIATVKTTTNIYDTATRRQLLMPQGSTILVKYHSADLRYGNQRLPVTSTLLTLPNGKTIELDGEPLMDPVGQAGLVTRVNNHFWRAVPAVLISGVLKGSQQVVTTTNPLAGGVASSAAQYGEQTVRPYIDMRPTIEVDAGEACNAILTRAIQLPAYQERG